MENPTFSVPHGNGNMLPPRTALSFVVTGTPRSGTTYVARLLQKFGIDCPHERRFTPWEAIMESHRLSSRPWGDSSWLAAPFLGQLPAETKVFHVVREPLNALNSIIGTGQIDWPDDYRTFIARYCWGDPDYWPKDVALEAQTFWVRWNEMIEHSGRVVLRFKVEEPESAVRRMADEIGVQNLSDAFIADVIASVRTDVNARKHRGDVRLTKADLTPEFRNTARRYGYDY